MKRAFAAIGAAILIAGTALSGEALTLPYSATGAYRNSTYHQNLTLLTETGDEAFDTVAAALSQLGYHEGNGAAEYHGKGTGSGNYTEYGRAFGKVSGTYGYAWCAVFASWCLRVAGAADAAGGGFSSCSLWLARLRELGLYSTRASGYTPKAGDLIFFRSAGAGRASDHMGVVRYVKGGRVYTVEGNSSNRVSAHDYALTDTYIVGYGKPQYGGEKLTETALSLEDKATGFYLVTNDFLNVRAAASASSKKLGQLLLGDMIAVTEIKNGWGKFVYKGQTAYVSLDYADFASPLLYTVRLSANGTEQKVSRFSFEVLKAPEAPAAEGSKFSHWAANGTSFKVGDILPEEDLTLTAVYEKTAPPEAPAPTPPAAPETPDTSVPPLPETSLPGGIPDDAPLLPEDAPTVEMPSLPMPLPPAVGETIVADPKAAAHAGVISGMLSAVLGIWWYVRRFLM